jgi:type I restriction enzyme R subunit
LVVSGGVVFTTIHKFFPHEKGDRHQVPLERRNIVVIADEAHRSHCAFIGGFARHGHDPLPHACCIGFSGRPIEKADAAPPVFGDSISVHDIQLAPAISATTDRPCAIGWRPRAAESAGQARSGEDGTQAGSDRSLSVCV